MDLNYLKKLIKLIDSSELSELEIEEEGTKIRIAKSSGQTHSFVTPAVMPNMNGGYNNAAAEQASPLENKSQENKPAEKPVSENTFEVRSPMVGTFYRAPSPDADPYVKAGDMVGAGSVLCIIEAMKLMNEIECEVSGKIVQVLAENGQAVEYNQPLFLVEKS